MSISAQFLPQKIRYGLSNYLCYSATFLIDSSGMQFANVPFYDLYFPGPLNCQCSALTSVPPCLTLTKTAEGDRSLFVFHKRPS